MAMDFLLCELRNFGMALLIHEKVGEATSYVGSKIGFPHWSAGLS